MIMWRTNEKNLTRMTLEIADAKTSWEVPYNDCNMEDLLNGFTGMLISHTWLPITVYKEMVRFAQDQLEILEDKPFDPTNIMSINNNKE